LGILGKTVPSYRIALEEEISRWSGFAWALRKDDREAFEELMDMCRGFVMASGNATNPTVFEPMVISILLSQQQKIRQLEKQLKPTALPLNASVATPELSQPSQPETKAVSQPASSGGGQSRLS
jgi:hypothetical protein